MIALSGLNPAAYALGCPAAGRLDLVSLLRMIARPADTAPKARPAAEAREELEDIGRSQQGDSQAYARIVQRHQDHIARILWRFTRDTQVHEELVQDVFVDAYLSLPTYRGQAPLEHWLARIATRVGYRFWKQSKRPEAQALTVEDWDRLASAEKSTDQQKTADLVHRLLAMLDPADRLVLTLRYLDGCSIDQTADRTGWSRPLVKVRSWRARKKLKALIELGGLETEL